MKRNHFDKPFQFFIPTSCHKIMHQYILKLQQLGHITRRELNVWRKRAINLFLDFNVSYVISKSHV
eukprot:UN12218